MKKLGLFTNFQFDDVLYRYYQNCLKELIAKRTKGAGELQVEIINVLTQGTLFANDNPVINPSLFESCFRSSLEYAANVLHCDVLALATQSTHLHSIADETFLENAENCPDAQFVSFGDCAIAICNRYKRLTRPGILCTNDIEQDGTTRSRFQEAGYNLVGLLDSETLYDLNRSADMVLEANHLGNPDPDELRYICSTVETAAKAANVNGILSVGYFELCQVLLQGGARPQTINLIDEHIKAIADAILS